MQANLGSTVVEIASPRPRQRNSLAAGTLAGAHDDPIEQLGHLDDTVFAAIAGRPDAINGLKSLWPEAKALLGPTLIAESRDQYVRHALRVWRESLRGGELRDAASAQAALDVVSLLFDE